MESSPHIGRHRTDEYRLSCRRCLFEFLKLTSNLRSHSKATKLGKQSTIGKMKETKIGNCEQVWQKVKSPKCNRHSKNDASTSTTFKDDFATCIQDIANIVKTTIAQLDSLSILIQTNLNESSDLSQNLATHSTPILHLEQSIKPTTPVSNSEQQ